MKRYNFANNKKKGSIIPYMKSPKKAKPGRYLTVLKIYRFDPMACVCVFTKNGDDSKPAFTKGLSDAIKDDVDWIKPLKLLPITANRKVMDIDEEKALKVNGYNWRVFIKIFTDNEMNDTDKAARSFGTKLAKLFNDNISQKWKYPEDCEFWGVENQGAFAEIKNLSSFVMQETVVDYCSYCFADSLEDGSFFEQKELLEELFPGVDDPKNLF